MVEKWRIISEPGCNFESSKSEILKFKDDLQQYFSDFPVAHEFDEEVFKIKSEIFDCIEKILLCSDEKESEIFAARLNSAFYEWQNLELTLTEYKNEKLTKLSVLLILVLSIFAILTVYLTLIYKKTHKDKEETIKFNKQILQIQEAEKRFLSHELHDTVAQDLRSIKFITTEIPDSPQALAATELTDKVIKNIRSICYNLTPPELEYKKVAEAIMILCSQWSLETQIECPVAITNPEILNGLNELIQLNIFRMVQESLQNIKKHAKAQEASVIIRNDSENLYLIICDDGIGFDRNKIKNTSFGLRGMKDRCESCGGTFRLESGNEIGTEIKITIPLTGDNPK